MKFVDLHCDFLSKAASGASFEVPAEGQAIGKAAVVQGNLSALCTAVFCGDSEKSSREEMMQSVQAQLAAFDRLTEVRGGVRYFCGTNTRALLTLEGLDYLQSAEELGPLLARGMTAAGLMWNRKSAIGGSVHEDGPLTSLGREVVRTLFSRGVQVDLAHAGRHTFFDVAEVCEQPMVSHANAYAVTPHARNLQDDQIRLLIERKSLLGITFYVPFAGGDDLEALWKHIAHILELGGEDILAIGSDFDGCSPTVRGLKTAADYGAVAELLAQKGVGKTVTEKICYQNAARFLNL